MMPEAQSSAESTRTAIPLLLIVCLSVLAILAIHGTRVSQYQAAALCAVATAVVGGCTKIGSP